ncbi:MAG: hypothetical protein HDT20_05520 [Oscillibacter sp.]|nr:hypothetical protein [Oscillibacter sp.]
MEKMKPLFAHLESAERKAYEKQMRGCADLTPEFFYNQASYLASEKSLRILVSRTYELEAIYELYDELEIPLPDKFQRELAEGEKEVWYKRMKEAHIKYGGAVQVRKTDPLYPDDISELRINFFSGTYVTVPLGEGLINFCYADFDAAFEKCNPGYLRFIDDPASAPNLDRKNFSGRREAVVRAFELYEQVFPTLSEAFYTSLYTAIFPPLFMKKTERAVEFYQQYLRILQAEFLELIEFCFDTDFHPGVLKKLYPSERYSLWCRINERSSSYKRYETFQAASFAPHGTKMPYGLSWEELDEIVQQEIVLTEEQKAFAKEYEIEEYELEAAYRCPCFISSSYECSSVRDILYLEFSKLLEEGLQFQKCKRCGKFFLIKGDYHGQYCDRIAPGESRTCQQLAAQETYQNKLKGNGGRNALNIYQKYYKRYFARVQTGSLKKEKFKQWQYEAVQKRDACLDEKLTLEEFAGWLEDSMPNRAKQNFM